MASIGKLTVGKRLAEARSEPEHGPRDLMARGEHVGQCRRRLRTALHGADHGRVEPRARARHLIREIDAAVLPQEILVPAHAAVGRRLPRLAAQAAAVNHDDGHVPVTALRNLILHVHLVDHDLAAAERGSGRARGRLRQLLLLAADEETALARDRQRAVRPLRLEQRRSARRPPRHASQPSFMP